MCQDVLTWLKVACTARGGASANTGVPIVLHPLIPLHLPESVYHYLTAKVKGDLPALATERTMTGEVTSTLVGALRALTESRTTRGGEATERGTREAKAISEQVNKETFGTLLRYCNVTQVEGKTSRRCGPD